MWLNTQASSRTASDFGSVISRIFPRSLETSFYCEEVRSRFRALNLRLSIEFHMCVRVHQVRSGPPLGNYPGDVS